MNIKSLTKVFKKYRHADTILIYNMGKVGSSTLVQAIPNAYQVHTLYNDLPPVNTRLKNMSCKRNLIFIFNRLFMRLAFFLRKDKIKIVSVCRNPILRNRSMFFQDLELWLTKHNLEKGGAKSDYGLAPLIEAYQETFDHQFYTDWFTKELGRLTDFSTEQLNLEKGWQILQYKKYEILFVKLEELEKNKIELEKFLGVELMLNNQNVAEKKWYGDIYQEFKKLPIMECEEELLKHQLVKQLGYQ